MPNIATDMHTCIITHPTPRPCTTPLRPAVYDAEEVTLLHLWTPPSNICSKKMPPKRESNIDHNYHFIREIYI
jgi:hypothetical protein